MFSSKPYKTSLLHFIKRVLPVWLVLLSLLNVAAAQIPGYIDADILIELEAKGACDGETDEEKEVEQELDKDDYTLQSYPIQNYLEMILKGPSDRIVRWQNTYSEIFTPPPDYSEN